MKPYFPSTVMLCLAINYCALSQIKTTYTDKNGNVIMKSTTTTDDPYKTKPTAVGGIPEPRTKEQLGEAQVFPTVPYKPMLSESINAKAIEKEKLLTKPILPSGIHPPMRRFIQGEINDKYEYFREEYRNRKRDHTFKNEIENFRENILGIAEDAKKVSTEIEKLQTQINEKGIYAFENSGNWDDIWSDEFLKQFKGNPIEAEIALEQLFREITPKKDTEALPYQDDISD